MKQLSPGFIPGTLSGCFLKPLLMDLLRSLGSLASAFLRLNILFFFAFLLGSFGAVGSGFGNSSGCASLNCLRASLCLWLTIFLFDLILLQSFRQEEDGARRVLGRLVRLEAKGKRF